ncbi:MAG: hypothetical protein ACYTGB_02870 [Planctomycetota bacterium]|jgi:hypothetical protein
MAQPGLFDLFGKVDLGLLFADPGGMLMSMGIIGMLVLLLGLVVVAFIFVAAGNRKVAGMPVAAGAVALLLGLLGMALGFINVQDKVASVGGAVTEADLTYGATAAATPAVMGLGIFLLGALASAVLGLLLGKRPDPAGAPGEN